MTYYNFVSTRDLKNNTNKILRVAEDGRTIIVTRHGKPVATIKPFKDKDLKDVKVSLYHKVKSEIGQQHPELLKMSKAELKKLNDELSAKVNIFSSWEEMDRASKGDKYGLSR